MALLENDYADRISSEDGLPLRITGHNKRCIDSLTRRLLSAIKTLAVVRRLALPALQVNGGQVNIIDK